MGHASQSVRSCEIEKLKNVEIIEKDAIFVLVWRIMSSVCRHLNVAQRSRSLN